MNRPVAGPRRHGRTRRRLGLAIAGLLATALLAPPAVVQAAPLPPPDSRQEAYAQAAKAYDVPEEILLAVSYLESRWDTHAGEPSRGAGYGPMHLTDVVAANRGTFGHTRREDRRGDDARPLDTARAREAREIPALSTLRLAADLTGLPPEELRSDPVANIRGGAALLAHYQEQLGGKAESLADWYGAVARYSGATDQGTAADFADEAYAILAEGKRRTTDDGHSVRLRAHPVRPDRAWLLKLDLRPAQDDDAECPRSITCEWIPSAYEEIGDGDYGNHDQADRPESQRIRYIVIHDTEGAYDGVVSLTQDPTYAASWQYTLRNSDGHIAQHIRSEDVAWHAGNWYVNAKSIGLEHEGWAARGTWYSEAMYRKSAKLVRYLARKFDIPLDRQHILGHDNVQGPTGDYIAGMHWDPGPFWDWAHYFDLLGAPLRPEGIGRFGSSLLQPGMLTIKPDFDRNVQPYTGCENNPGPPGEEVPPECGEWGSSAVFVHTEPRHDAPLVRDIGLHPDTDGESGYDVADTGGRASTGQRFAVAEVRGDWTAIWYLGQKGWIHNPRGARTALPAVGLVATPKDGLDEIPVYGRAYPEAEAYEGTDIPPQEVIPLPYTLHAGEQYVVGQAPEAEYYRAVTFDDFENDHVVVRGEQKYYQIQIGHRVGYVQAEDVDIRFSWLG